MAEETPKETIFSKIMRHERPAEILYEDELVIAFLDIAPQAPTHILIIPKKIIPTVNDVKAEDEAALGRMFTAAAKIAKTQNIDASGYRLIMNCNRDAGQVIWHIHMHLVGGCGLGPLLASVSEH